MSKEQKHGADSCPYNDGVACESQKHCDRCGWNPEVVAARNADIGIKIKEGTL